MGDKGKILAGSLLFLALVLSPVWYNAVRGGEQPKPDLAPAKAKSAEIWNGAELCVRPTDEMRKYHMTMLIEWRDLVVRQGGPREYITRDDRHTPMSLTRGCLDCHSNKSEFCDRCHLNAGVTPKCFDCHLVPPKNQMNSDEIINDLRYPFPSGDVR
jgi:hypothetical protein